MIRFFFHFKKKLNQKSENFDERFLLGRPLWRNFSETALSKNSSPSPLSVSARVLRVLRVPRVVAFYLFILKIYIISKHQCESFHCFFLYFYRLARLTFWQPETARNKRKVLTCSHLKTHVELGALPARASRFDRHPE